jgi:hypothetical protein
LICPGTIGLDRQIAIATDQGLGQKAGLIPTAHHELATGLKGYVLDREALLIAFYR